MLVVIDGQSFDPRDVERIQGRKGPNGLNDGCTVYLKSGRAMIFTTNGKEVVREILDALTNKD